MSRLEFDGNMVRFDGRIIAEIAYCDQGFADIIEAANYGYTFMDNEAIENKYWNKTTYQYHIYRIFRDILIKAGWWKS